MSMELVRELGQVTLESARGAVLEFFRPVKGVAVWFKAILKIPELFHPLEGLPAILLQQEKALAGLREVEVKIQVMSDFAKERSHEGQRLPQALKREQFILGSSSGHIAPWLNDYGVYFMPEGKELLRVNSSHLHDYGSMTQHFIPQQWKRVGTERKVFRYLIMAADFWQRGDIEHANEVLVLLDRLGERHELRTTLIYVWFNLGELWFEQKNLTRAERYFQRVVTRNELDSNEVLGAAYSRLALVYHHRRRFDKTTDYAKRALEIFGKQGGERDILWQAYSQLAAVLLEQESEAIETFEKLLEKGGSHFVLPWHDLNR